MSEWKLHRREYACAECARVFVDDEAYFSVLTIDEGSFGREDHCAVCFPQRPAPSEAREPIWWRTRRRSASKKGLAVDFEAIEALFLALEGRTDERLCELRYLLALLLMRKRRLKLVRVVRSEAGEAMVVRRPRRTEEHEVRVFDLTPERMEALRRELERIVEGAGAEDVLAGPPVQEPDEPDDAGEPAGDEPGDPELSARAG